MSLFEALSWIKQVGYEKVHVEVDAKLVTDTFGGSNIDISVFVGCRQVLESQPYYVLGLISRDVNTMSAPFL